MFSLASLALRFPVAGELIKIGGKWILIAAVIGGAVWAFNSWKSGLVEEADAAGFERARAAFQHAVEQSNAREQQSQARLDQMAISFGHLAAGREQQISLTLKPMIERIEREVATDPRYSECSASDGVLGELNAGRAGVDASITASNP